MQMMSLMSHIHIPLDLGCSSKLDKVYHTILCRELTHLKNVWQWYLSLSSLSYLYPCCWDHIKHLTASRKSICYGRVQKECSLKKRRRKHFRDSCGVDPKWGSRAGGSLSIVRQIDLLRGGIRRKRSKKIYAEVHSQSGTIQKPKWKSIRPERLTAHISR